MKKTLILGATDNPSRYANMAANKLVSKGHTIITIGIKAGKSAGVKLNVQEKFIMM